MAQKLSDLGESLSNFYIDDWKKQGRPVLGYFCTYIPKEIPYAGGILPFRVRGRGRERTLADALMTQITCPFSRSCFELALKGEYAFLDGLISMNCCENMRRMSDLWVNKVKTSYFQHLSVPYKSDEDAIEWYKEELCIFKDHLEKFYGVIITDEKLRHSIQVYNETRRLLKELYELRRKRSPFVSGVEAQNMALMAYAIPPEEYNKLLRAFIDEINSRTSTKDYKARLIVIASLDDPTITGVIEERGGIVVAEVSCFGAISFWNPIQFTGDLMEGIARSYLTGVLCPRTPGRLTEKVNFIREMADFFDIDGIVFERMMFCTLWGAETMSLKKDLEELDIPLLIIDTEYSKDSKGQVENRVDAFLEIIQSRSHE